MAINSMEMTISGDIRYEISSPDGWDHYIKIDGISTAWFNPNKNINIFSLNLIQIEKFTKIVLPIVSDIDFIDMFNDKSKIYKFWNNGSIKRYKLTYNIIGKKTLTKITTRSGNVYCVDESYECIENALDACVWNTEMKEQL